MLVLLGHLNYMEAENNLAKLGLCVNIPFAGACRCVRGNERGRVANGSGRNAHRGVEYLRVTSDHGLLVPSVSP